MASHIGSGLTDVLYVLDEPSVGLHQRDNDRLLGTLKNLRDQGKAILLVSVELEEILSLADRVVVMFDGHITGERDAAQTNEKELGLLMAGITDTSAVANGNGGNDTTQQEVPADG